MFDNLLNSLKNICKSGSKDQAKMLILTSAIGWALSSAAQVCAIIGNNRLSDKEKKFLIPQEIYDGLTNIGAFLCFTLLAKKGVESLIKNKKIILKFQEQYASPVLTVVSIISGAIASNIVTPIVRNYFGAITQKSALRKKISTPEIVQPNFSAKKMQLSSNIYPDIAGKFLYPTTMKI